MPIIPREREAYFLILFLAQFVGWIIVVTINQAEESTLAVAITIGQSMAPLVILTTATTIMFVEGAAMLAERYLQRRYQEGRAVERKQWEDWNQRREKFEAENPGERFTEPPPQAVNSKK